MQFMLFSLRFYANDCIFTSRFSFRTFISALLFISTLLTITMTMLLFVSLLLFIVTERNRTPSHKSNFFCYNFAHVTLCDENVME